jgi:hypothetical protein
LTGFLDTLFWREPVATLLENALVVRLQWIPASNGVV